MTDRIDTAAEREKLAELRKYKLVHGEPEYRSQMLVRPGGAWVPVSIHRSTVYRLLDAIDAGAALQRTVDAEWNDAVEAAARIASIFGQGRQGMQASRAIEQAIRDLKRQHNRE